MRNKIGQSTLEYVIIIAAIIAAILIGRAVIQSGTQGMFDRARSLMGT